ncbi:MAG: PAS domain-containing protein [Rhodoferax sp.]|uniref:PAS domain-containing protein n=1 Tax=Rhodoferax sp. TaxID=50421 RepID=UPI0026285D4B|nr:PAS domain-containing protein [Rhodoferax sp.]MDD2880815.1 PAS domain-containing protein [Rhodoferax sp.]
MADHCTAHAPEVLFRMSQIELNAVQEGVLITDANGIILALNDAFISLSGFSKAETLGRTCRFFQGPGTDQQTLNEMRQAQKNGTIFSGEVLNYRKDYSAFWNELTIFPWRNHRREVTHFVGLIKDITERKLGQASPQEPAEVLP